MQDICKPGVPGSMQAFGFQETENSCAIFAFLGSLYKLTSKLMIPTWDSMVWDNLKLFFMKQENTHLGAGVGDCVIHPR